MKKRISFTSVLKQKEPAPCMANSNKGGLADLVQDYQQNPYQQYNLRFDAPLVKSKNSILSKQSKNQDRTFDDWIAQQARQNKENYFENQTKKTIHKQLIKYSKKIQKDNPTQSLKSAQKLVSKTSAKKNIKMSTLCQMFMQNQISDETQPIWRCKNSQSTESLKEKLRQSLPNNLPKQFVQENNFSQKQTQILKKQFTKVRDKKVDQMITNQSLGKKKKIGPLMIQLKKSITQEVESIAKKILSERVNVEQQFKQEDQNLLNDCPQQNPNYNRVAEINHQIQEYLKLKGKRPSENDHPTFKNNFQSKKSLHKTQYNQASMENDEERVGYSFGHNQPHDSHQVHYSNQHTENNMKQSSENIFKKSIQIPQSHIAKVQSLDFDSLNKFKKGQTEMSAQKLQIIEQKVEVMLKSSHGYKENKYPPRPYQKISFNKVMSKKSLEQESKLVQSFQRPKIQSPEMKKQSNLMSPEIEKFKKFETEKFQNRELQQPLLTEQKPNKLKNSTRYNRVQQSHQIVPHEEVSVHENNEDQDIEQTAYTLNLNEKESQRNQNMQQSLNYYQQSRYCQPTRIEEDKYQDYRNDCKESIEEDKLQEQKPIYLNICEPLNRVELSSKSVSIPVLERQINLNVQDNYLQNNKAIEQKNTHDIEEQVLKNDNQQQEFQCEKPNIIEKQKSQIFQIQRILIQNKEKQEEKIEKIDNEIKYEQEEKIQLKKIASNPIQNQSFHNEQFIQQIHNQEEKNILKQSFTTQNTNQIIADTVIRPLTQKPKQKKYSPEKEQIKLQDSISMRFSINLDSSVQLKQMPKPSYLQEPVKYNLRESIKRQTNLRNSIKQEGSKAQLDDFQFDLELD